MTPQTLVLTASLVLGSLAGACAAPSGATQSNQPVTRFARLSALTLDTTAQPTLRNGRRVDPKLFEASFFAKDLTCTATVVGAGVLLTAAHCVANGGAIAIEVGINQRSVTGICTQADGFHPKNNISPDYALCQMKDEVPEVPYFEMVNTDPTRLVVKREVLLTGFGCTQVGGGGDTSGKIYRVGESNIKTLPSGSENRFVVEGGAALCLGDSGGPTFLQHGKDGGPRIQISVNALGTDSPSSGLASLSTPAAITFMTGWTGARGLRICGLLLPGESKPPHAKCRTFS